MKVFTTQGLIEYGELTVNDIVEIADNHRKIATEYHHNGELVRRDVVVNVFRPLISDAVQGNLDG